MMEVDHAILLIIIANGWESYQGVVMNLQGFSISFVSGNYVSLSERYLTLRRKAL